MRKEKNIVAFTKVYEDELKRENRVILQTWVNQRWVKAKLENRRRKQWATTEGGK
jgi:hypothetical protein